MTDFADNYFFNKLIYKSYMKSFYGIVAALFEERGLHLQQVSVSYNHDGTVANVRVIGDWCDFSYTFDFKDREYADETTFDDWFHDKCKHDIKRWLDN